MRRHLSMLAAVVSLLIALTSCRSAAPSADYQALARAGIRLGVDIDYDDDRLLYVTAAGWVGVPYRYGGESKRGVDCSGFVRAICRTVYGKEVSRTADEQYKSDCRRVRRSKLRGGDLVFFKNARRSRKASHVGIYLKDNKFIHASNSGVIVSDLGEPYYDKTWLGAGRLR